MDAIATTYFIVRLRYIFWDENYSVYVYMFNEFFSDIAHIQPNDAMMLQCS